jgi:hypothetical protein
MRNSEVLDFCFIAFSGKLLLELAEGRCDHWYNRAEGRNLQNHNSSSFGRCHEFESTDSPD